MIVELLRENSTGEFLADTNRVWARGEAADRIAARAGELTGRARGDVRVGPLELQTSVDSVLELLATLEAGRVAAPLSLREPEDQRRRRHDQLTAATAPTAGLLVRTSGTTSAGKWVLLELPALLHGARCAARRLDFGRSDSWLLNLPLWHVGGLGPIWRALVSGGALALPGAEFTHASLVATQLQRLLRDELPVEYAACRRILLGGGPCPPALLEAAHARGLEAVNSYGMTETGSLCIAAGRPIGSCDLEISDEDEILVRGPALFAGYLDLETGELDLPTTPGGWFPTGDLGRFREDGRLEVFGRRDNQFISGGENIQPEEIEAALLSLEDVEQAVVVGVPDKEFGMRPVAFVVPAARDYAESLAPLLPKYKIPIRFLTLRDTEGTGVKLRRRELSRLAVEILRSGG